MTVYRDQCAPSHNCNAFDHQASLPDKPAETIRVDYRYRCDECGQRYHVTGFRYPDGQGESKATPVRGKKRSWLNSRSHPGGTS